VCSIDDARAVHAADDEPAQEASGLASVIPLKAR
jgi:hypothetical protein